MKRFCDNITNLSLPEECDEVVIPHHRIPGNFYGAESKVKRDVNMDGGYVGGGIHMNRLSVKGSLFMSDMKIGGSVTMAELYVGGILSMYGLHADSSIFICDLDVGQFLNMANTEIERLYLVTTKKIVIPYINFNKANIKQFEDRGPILVRDVSKEKARLPKNLEQALEKGVELVKQMELVK